MNSQSEQELTLGDLVVVLRRRRKIVYGFIAALGLLAILYCLVATKRYQAVGLVEVQSKNQDQLGIESIAGTPAGAESDATAATLNIQTLASILQSDSLALKTIKDLGLENTSDYKGHWNPVSWALGLFSSSGTSDKPGASLEDSPNRRRRVLAVFNRLYKVKAQSGTRLIEISYLSSDPQIAAAVVNQMAKGLEEYNDQLRQSANQQVVTAITDQLEALRKRSDDLQKQVAEMESKSGVLNTGTTDAAGNPGAYSSVVEQLKIVSTQLAEAQQNRILRQEVANAAEKGDSEALSSLAGNTSMGAVMTNSLGLIQTLRGQEATAQAALAQTEAKFGSSYTKLDELRANLVEIRHSIQTEVARLRDRAKNDFRIASKAEDDTRAEYDRLRAEAESFNGKNRDLTQLRQEADAATKLYQDMQNKLQQAGVLQSVKGSVISVVDPGRAPGKPSKPNMPLYIVLALVAGLFLGVIAALVSDLIDNTIHAVYDAERIAPNGLLGVTPALDKKIAAYGPALTAVNDPASSFAGSMRALRSAVLQKGAEGHGTVIQVTSGVAGEGKTTVSSNLAALLAQSGKKVLLVDADLRSGSLRSLFGVKETAGLSELLKGQSQIPTVTSSKIPGLEVLGAGAATDAVEQLGSESFRGWVGVWREKYDYVVFDCGALMPQADSLALMPVSDLIIQVVRPFVSEKSQIGRTHGALASTTNQPVAVVLNGLHPEEDGYSSYFGSRRAGQK